MDLLKCEVCGKECKGAFGLRTHMRSHDLPKVEPLNLVEETTTDSDVEVTLGTSTEVEIPVVVSTETSDTMGESFHTDVAEIREPRESELVLQDTQHVARINILCDELWSRIMDGDCRAIINSYRDRTDISPLEMLNSLFNDMKDGDARGVINTFIATEQNNTSNIVQN